MITLAMDTSHVFLVLALIKDDQLVDSVQKKCWKRQSEEIFLSYGYDGPQRPEAG